MTFIHYYLSRAGVSLCQLLFPTAGTAGGDNPVTFFRCLKGADLLQKSGSNYGHYGLWKSDPGLQCQRDLSQTSLMITQSHPGTALLAHTQHPGLASHLSSQWGPAGLSSTATATSQRPPAGPRSTPPKVLWHGKLRVVLRQNGHSLLLFIFLKNQNLLLNFLRKCWFFLLPLPSFGVFCFVIYFSFYIFNFFCITILYHNFEKNTLKVCHLT